MGTRNGSPHAFDSETHKLQTSLLLTCWPEDSHMTTGNCLGKGKCSHVPQLRIRGKSLSRGLFIQFLLCFDHVMKCSPGLFMSSCH